MTRGWRYAFTVTTRTVYLPPVSRRTRHHIKLSPGFMPT